MSEFTINYTVMSVDNDELHGQFDQAIERVKKLIGTTYPLLINGEEREAESTFAVKSPIDQSEVVYFQRASRADVKEAIEAAKAAFPAWAATPYEERLAIVEKAADMITDNLMELSVMMIMEMGKNRIEAMGDVQESADLLRYYCYQMRQNEGFVRQMNSFGDNDTNTSILKPYGVWAVISPFNFPLALAAGPAAAALVTGNTIVVKPSSDAPWTAYMLAKYLVDAGAPPGVVNFVTGPGSTAGVELIENQDVDGITFTGSYDVGFNQIYHSFAPDQPKPVIVEMGGKNPAIVSDKADLEKAAQGILRAAFGLGGQKCSACSRAYVHADVYDAFVEKLLAKTAELKVGDPLDRYTFLGPLVNQYAYTDYKRFMDKARADGTVLFGGNQLTDGEMENGFYVEPAIITDLPDDHELVKQELFVPILFVTTFTDLDDALARANDTQYGLTAGFYSQDEAEVQKFLDTIEAGVVYVNRAAGATTGAWPGYQTFGGWKSSGSSGRNIGGHYSLLNYMREQSQTIIHD